jgi:hypothetical protein
LVNDVESRCHSCLLQVVQISFRRLMGLLLFVPPLFYMLVRIGFIRRMLYRNRAADGAASAPHAKPSKTTPDGASAAVKSSRARRCAKCGQQVAGLDSFCSSCGNSLRGAAASNDLPAHVAKLGAEGRKIMTSLQPAEGDRSTRTPRVAATRKSTVATDNARRPKQKAVGAKGVAEVDPSLRIPEWRGAPSITTEVGATQPAEQPTDTNNTKISVTATK